MKASELRDILEKLIVGRGDLDIVIATTGDAEGDPRGDCHDIVQVVAMMDDDDSPSYFMICNDVME